MDVYLVTFNSHKPPEVTKEIAYMLGHPGGVNVCTNIKIHSRNRCHAKDYDTMICFSFSAPRTYRLHDNLPVYVDDRHSSVYYAKDNLYAIFKKDLTDNVWNIVRYLLPAPDKVLNCSKNFLGARCINKGVTFIDTKAKCSVFDEQDV